jgi:hypothetical protein
MRIWLVVMIGVFAMALTSAAGVAAGKSTDAPAAAPLPAPATSAASAEAMPPEEIVAGGMVILRLRVTVAGMTPAQRATALYNRLNDIISDRTLKPQDYRTVKKGSDWLVMAGTQLFVTVTPEEAKINQATPLQLAQIWASNLRVAVALARPVPLPGEG